MLTSHSYHRQNFSQDNNPWQRDEFRHNLRLSSVDAQERAIKDGDLVRVYNDKGEIVMPAYVTSRITPGTVILPHGAWPEISKEKTALMPGGLDRRGADNFLTSSKYHPWVLGVICCSEFVQVEKKKGTIWFFFRPKAMYRLSGLCLILQELARYTTWSCQVVPGFSMGKRCLSKCSSALSICTLLSL
jgi:hypothetical protein